MISKERVKAGTERERITKRKEIEERRRRRKRGRRDGIREEEMELPRGEGDDAIDIVSSTTRSDIERA